INLVLSCFIWSMKSRFRYKHDNADKDRRLYRFDEARAGVVAVHLKFRHK
ncbi:hypothetical protein B296_00025299, partial [Ensete ventricosum]